jgi:hypothetical protein
MGNITEIPKPDLADQATIEVAEQLLEQAKAGEIVGIAYCAVGRDDVGYGLAGQVISGGLNVLGMLRLIEHKLVDMFDGVLDHIDVDGDRF